MEMGLQGVRKWEKLGITALDKLKYILGLSQGFRILHTWDNTVYSFL